MSAGPFHFFYDGPFSQFARSEMTIDGEHYLCAEQYMMAQKARLFRDAGAYLRIMKSERPAEIKAIGRQVYGFNDETWRAVARDVVARGNLYKFQLDEFREALLETRFKTLAEASPTDVIWGIGLSMADVRRFDVAQWRGKNWLGQILTDLRISICGE